MIATHKLQGDRVMKNLKVPIFVACLCVIVAVSSSPAEGFRLSDLNPFAKKTQTTPNRRFREPKSRSILPRISLFPKSSSNKPSTLQRINTGTKNFLVGAADFLNPFNDGDDMPPASPTVGGSRGFRDGGATFSRRDSEPKKPSFLARLNPFAPEEPEPINDVNDFLSQPRMQYR
jgi:hypothetical protein